MSKFSAFMIAKTSPKHMLTKEDKTFKIQKWKRVEVAFPAAENYFCLPF